MSDKPKVEIHYNGAEDGDWVVIKLDGEIYASGHTFTLHDLRAPALPLEYRGVVTSKRHKY